MGSHSKRLNAAYGNINTANMGTYQRLMRPAEGQPVGEF